MTAGLKLVLLLTSLLSAIHNGQTKGRSCFEYDDVKLKKFEGRSLTVSSTNRPSQLIVSNIFKIYIEEYLGLYSPVDIQIEPDYFNASLALQRLDDNNINGSLINLEVWAPVDFQLPASSKVKEFGTVTPRGRFGWFIPKETFDLPSTSLHTWQTFQQKETSSLFNIDLSLIKHYLINTTTNDFYCSDQLCENGMFVPNLCRHQEQHCAILLTSYPDETIFLRQHIIELNMYVKVAWVGPNLREVLDLLKKTYKENAINKPIVFFSWIPSPLINKETSSLISVSFPVCERLGGQPSIGCLYESKTLLKLASEKVLDLAQHIDQCIKDIHLTNSDYEEMFEVYKASNATTSYYDMACKFMKDTLIVHGWKCFSLINEDIYKTLYIGGIFPNHDEIHHGSTIVDAAKMAVQAINADNTILPNHTLALLNRHGNCDGQDVMKEFISFMANSKDHNLVGVLGPACTDALEPLLMITKLFKAVVISYSAEGSSFSDRTKYPYFFRTIGENQLYKYVYLKIMNELGWKQVAALIKEGQKYSEYLIPLRDLLQTNNKLFITKIEISKNRPNQTLSQYLEDLKNRSARIIIGDFYDDDARAVMCQAYHLEMTQKQGYVWFLPHWLRPSWYDTDAWNKNKTSNNDGTVCTTAQMITAINGHFSLAHAYYADDNDTMQEHISVGHWKERYRNQSGLISNYGGYAYDGVWAFAYALDKLSRINTSLVNDIHNEGADKYLQILQNTHFSGVSGRIQFLGPSRFAEIDVIQWIDEETYIVGSFEPVLSLDGTEVVDMRLKSNLSSLRWLTEKSLKPGDGSDVGLKCVLKSLSEFLDVECEVAIVVANIVGFGFLGIVLIVVFLLLKRSYDKKIAATKEYMRSFGMDLINSNMSDADKWEIKRDHVVINRKLGQGAFGTVYGGEAYFNEKGWVGVAVKTLKINSTTEQKLDFLGEAEVMKKFDHKNIVKLLGVCTKDEPLYTVMEFMLYGDLKTYLLGRRHLVNQKDASDEVSSTRLTTMALHVASALSYLAEKKYVHRDVACRNCLVNSSKVVKLGDFGMTRQMFESDYYKFNRKGMMPVRWMAPESLAFGVFYPSSDIWSFGVLLYEMVTFGSFPFQGMTNYQVMEHVKAGNYLDIPKGVKLQLESLMRSCWNQEYKKRPKASEIVVFLADNSRIISPCLDAPISSVQFEDTGEMDPPISQITRKVSVGFSKIRDTSNGDECETPNGEVPHLTSCPSEPLLGYQRTASLGLSKFVPLTKRESCGSIHETLDL